MTSRIGSTIAERYRIDGELGDGGSATVYRATDLQLGREVAVKLLHRTNMTPEIAVRFEREARVGAALSHPHVVQTLDFGRTEGTLFLVTQIVEGGDLHRFHTNHAPLSIATIVTIGIQIAQALTAAHAIGLVHRDLKPDNVLVDPVRHHGDDPWLRVADFGLAFIDESHDPRQGRLTTDGMVSGTPTYMAPEQVSDGAIGPHSDIYAFGCLLYELLLGDPPFVGPHGKVFADHLYAPPRPPRLVRADIPSGLDELVLRMLSKATADRPTAEMVHRRLLAFVSSARTTEGRSTDARTSRAERMLTTPPPLASLEPVATRASRAVRVGIAGDPPIDLLAALEVAELDTVSADEPCDAVIALDANVEQLAALVALSIPVIADVSPRDFERVTTLLRLGVAEVVMRPLVPAIVVSKLQRVLRRRTEKT